MLFRHLQSPIRTLLKHTSLAALLLWASISGFAVSCGNECESEPTNTELVELEIIVAEMKGRQRDRGEANRQCSDTLLATLNSHSFEQSSCLAAPALTEHAVRNGGIGTPLRC